MYTHTHTHATQVLLHPYVLSGCSACGIIRFSRSSEGEGSCGAAAATQRTGKEGWPPLVRQHKQGKQRHQSLSVMTMVNSTSSLPFTPTRILGQMCLQV